jgi:sterol desaturase/sphingolipid hydroxylase (fatty acid hydroxylase superfamily)
MDFTVKLYLIWVCAAVLFIVLELAIPARPLSYRHVIAKDILALVTYAVLYQIAIHITDRIGVPNYVHWRIAALPFPLRLVLFVFIVDFGTYWMHRLLHLKIFWRVHRWHHLPSYIYWLAGVRGSLPQLIMVNLPFVLALPILQPVGPRFFLSWGALLMVSTNLMHANIQWRSRWLENFIVTPRFHHIHHGDDPVLYQRNFGIFFTIWDRVFGTYLDPEKVRKDFSLGVSEEVHPVRLALGI